MISFSSLQEVDVRAGGGQIITIGEMVRLFLTKLDWFSSLFPRIPVPIQVNPGFAFELFQKYHDNSILFCYRLVLIDNWQH